MLELVTLEEARDHLRLDEGQDDTWLGIFIPVISQAVALWLKMDWRLYEPEIGVDGEVVTDSAGDPVPAIDSSGEPIVKPVVRGAVLMELASAYRFREGEGKDNMVPADAGHGYVLNKASTALLAPLRKSTVA